MKRILLAGTALVGVAVAAAPAHADLKLDLGGYFRGYAVYTDNNESGSAVVTTGGGTFTTTGASLRKFGFRYDREIHFTGETTTDMGLTVGVHSELKLGNQGSAFNGFSEQGTPTNQNFGGQSWTDETYAYFSGSWGRVNFGAEDGAAYLLQVAAPSADSNVDGLRPYIQAFNPDVWDDGVANGSFANQNIVLGYDNADFRSTDRITYLTPKWNGFQAGVSYAPTPGMQTPYGGTYGLPTDNNAGQFENLWEASARWDGEFSGIGFSLGGGYSAASAQNSAGAGAGNFGSDDLRTWDGGVNLTWQGFSLGGAYKSSDTGVSGADHDATTWVAGLGWDNGPWHVGASYLDDKFDSNAYGIGAIDDLKLQRWTAGGGYTYGPGMSFRGSVAWLETDNGIASNQDPTQTQVAVGTDINF
jgi:hypothetical protein